MDHHQLIAIRVVLCCLIIAPFMSHAEPIRSPDLKKCAPAFATSRGNTTPRVNLTFNCCLPLPEKEVVRFSLKKYPRIKRVRRPAHLADEEYINKYNKAYELMRALPPHDPRSFSQQADMHCAFCNGAYKQRGSANLTLQIHFSWLFLPWHRWYLYFHERILASLIDDPHFSLPFWNWDNQIDGNTMPAFFAQNVHTALFDAKRNHNHLPPSLVRLNALSNTTNATEIINDNLNHMYQSVVTASTAELFTGGAYRVGTNSTAKFGGSMENGVHTAIHFWTGDPKQPLMQDMGVFSTAARDPIFYAHHSNVDRLWDVWRHSLPGGRRKDHTDGDFLNAEFVFYDEHANLVKVKAKDALSSKKLGINYTKVKADQLWINYLPRSTTTTSASAAAPATFSSEIHVIGPAASDHSKGIKLGEKLSGWVSLPSSTTSAAAVVSLSSEINVIGAASHHSEKSINKRGEKFSAWASQPSITNSAIAAAAAALSSEIHVIGAASDHSKGIKVGEKLNAWVSQPKLNADDKVEVLMIQGLEVKRESFVQLLVFLNLPDANEHTKTDSDEFVGAFNILPSPTTSKPLITNLKFELGDNIKRIGLHSHTHVVITILVKPYNHFHADVKIKGITITYE